MIPEIEPCNNYKGDGKASQFDFDFYIENGSQLKVEHTNSEGAIAVLKQDVDYTIHEIGNKNGSYITFPRVGSSYSVLAENEIISLQLTLPIAQESEYGTSSELDLKSLEYSLDYLTRICQIISRQLSRTAKIQEGSEQSIDEFIQDLKAGSNLAKRWAEYMDDSVDGSGYSAKYHANEALGYRNVAQEQADRAEQYADSAEFGMKWIGFAVANWVADNNKYKLNLSGIPIVNAVYKGTWSSKQLIANIDINTTDTGCEIVSLEAFDGYILAASSILGNYEHEQTLASNEWIIDHNTGHYPCVTIVDDNNVVMLGTVQYVTLNRIKVTFNEPVTGKAYLR